MIILRDLYKAFSIIQHNPMIKILNKLGFKHIFFSVMKGIFSKVTVHLIPNCAILILQKTLQRIICNLVSDKVRFISNI